MLGSRRLVALATVLAFLVPPDRLARSDEPSEKAVCADKYQSAQRLRAAGKLALARTDLLRCAEQSCPAFVSNDCKTWLAQVEADLPTLVFAVLDPQGRDVPSAVIRVDGADVPHATDGLGHAVDPGGRLIQVVAGDQQITQRIVARMGEKSRRVELRLEGAPPPTAYVIPPTTEPATASSGRAPVPLVAYVLGGIGLVAVGVGTVLWATGTSAAHSYNDACASSGCTASQRDSAQRQLVAGDVAWALGIAAGVAAVVVVLQPRGANAGAQVSVGADGLVVSGRF